jgi:hypothetical protein
VLGGKRVPNHVAYIVGHKVRARRAQRIHYAG